MGGGGGDSYKGVPSDYRAKLDQVIQAQQVALNQQIDEYLARLLAQANSRDPALVQNRLDEIANRLRDVVELDRLLFGGSVAKRTAVDGISDVDALVLLDRDPAQTQQPSHLIKMFANELRANCTGTVQAGQMSVTVTYSDGMVIELLPAIRRGQDIMIGRPDGVRWQRTAPKVFREVLTKANQKAGGNLVRAIKLFKILNDQQPVQRQLEGYHIEALAVDAMRGYQGPYSPRMLLHRVLESAAGRVLSRMPEPTGQSRFLDDSLGLDQSLERRNIAQMLLGIKRRLDAAVSVADWQTLFGGQ